MHSFVLSGLVLVSFAGVAQTAPPAGSPSKGALPHFDLTYVPGAGPQGIVAVRPAEIARHLPALPSAGQARTLLGTILGAFVDVDFDAAQPPALADLEECVLGLNISFTMPTAEQGGTSMFGAGLPCCFRTVKPFDWAGAVRKWFPKAESVNHAGRAYFRVPCRLKLSDESGKYVFGILVADNRTVVFADETEICGLLDRLKDGKTFAPPPGWQEVSRDLVAVALDQRKTPCVKGKWPEEPAEARPIGVLFETLQVAAFGVAVEETPTGGRLVGRMVAMTKDADSAGRTVEAIKTLVTMLRTAMAVDKNGPIADLSKMINAMFDRATLTQDGQTVRGRIDLPFDMIKSVSTAAQRQSETPPQPPSPPPQD